MDFRLSSADLLNDYWAAPAMPPSPDERVNQIEQEAEDKALNVPEANRAAYRRMVRKEIANIRAVIAQLRVDGVPENNINLAINAFFSMFYESSSRFHERNDQFRRDQEKVVHSNRATAEKIRKCKVNFAPIVPKSAAQDAVCKRPSFSKAKQAFEDVKSLDQLQEIAGGVLKDNFDGKIFVNGCASRISYVLEQTGITIPAIPGQTVSGKNKEQYIYRLDVLETFLRNAFGPPDCEWSKGSVCGKSDKEKCSSLKGRKGIIIMKWESRRDMTSSGHAEVIQGWDLSNIIIPSTGVFWELPDDPENME